MKRNARNLCFVMLGMLCTTFAGAQLSGSLSQPLGTSRSAAAATTSTTIEPGANNLLTPDERQVPFDAIGASLDATPLTPYVTQYNALGRMPFQADNSIQDATLATGLHSHLPTNVVEIIGRTQARTGSSSSLQSSNSPMNSFSINSASSLEGQSALMGVGMKSGENAPVSSWRIGSMGSMLAIDPLPPPPEPPAPLKLVGEDISQTKKKKTGEDDKNNNNKNNSNKNSNKNNNNTDIGLQQADQLQDYSRSPLEAVTSSENSQDGTQSGDSPFKQLNQESFLNPDITSASSRPATSSSLRQPSETRSDFTNSRQSLLSGHSLNSNNVTNPPISRDQARLMKHDLNERQSKRKKWHNPILQQMEDNANADANQ